MKIGANKAFEVIGTKACLNLNADVGSGYIGNRAHNGPSTTIKQRSRTPRKRFGRAKPGTANENGTQQGVPPLRATSGAKVNADVGIRIYGLPHVKWTLHHPPAKGIDRGATISDRSRA